MNLFQIKRIVGRIKSSNIASRLVAGAFWSIAGKVIGSGCILFAFIVVARIIGVKQYGELGMVRSTIFMFSSFAGAGIGLTASRYIALYRNTNQTKTNEIYFISHYFSIIFGGVISFLLYFFAPLIAEKSLQAPYLVNDIRLGALALFLMTLNSTQTGCLQGFERFKSIALNTLIQSLAQCLLLIIGAYYWGIAGVLMGIIFSSLLLYILNYRSIRVNIPKKILRRMDIRTISRETLAVLWKFSLPAAMSSITMVPILWWCKIFVVQQSGFESMANYDVAEQWYSIILFIPSTLSGMIIPILANTLAEGTMLQYRKIVAVNIWINTIISAFATLVICLLAVFILKRYGAGFTETLTFRILMISTIPSAIAGVLGHIIASKGKMWAGFTLNFLWAIWLALFTLLFVGYFGYGALGLSFAMLCAYILHIIFSYAYMWKKVVNN